MRKLGCETIACVNQPDYKNARINQPQVIRMDNLEGSCRQACKISGTSRCTSLPQGKL